MFPCQSDSVRKNVLNSFIKLLVYKNRDPCRNRAEQNSMRHIDFILAQAFHVMKKYKSVFQYHFGSGEAWCFSACCSLCVSDLLFLSPLLLLCSFFFLFILVFFLIFLFLFFWLVTLYFCPSYFYCFCFYFCCLFFVFLANFLRYWYSFRDSAGFFLFFLPYTLLPPACGALVLQVANQSAISQEQVDSILQENDALRTNLAALEQVINLENTIYKFNPQHSVLWTNIAALKVVKYPENITWNHNTTSSLRTNVASLEHVVNQENFIQTCHFCVLTKLP